jgi:hypothetical protein
MSDKFLKPVSSGDQARLASFEAKLDQLLEKELEAGGFGFLVSAAEALEQKAFNLRLEAAKRGKLNGKQPSKQRHLGVFQGVFLI